MAIENLTKPRIKVPENPRIGEVIEIRAVVTHVMETGNRRDTSGQLIPRNVVNLVVARFEGQVVFQARLGSGIAANPFLVFPMRVTGPGVLELTWTDDTGNSLTERAQLTVAAEPPANGPANGQVTGPANGPAPGPATGAEAPAAAPSSATPDGAPSAPVIPR